MWGKVTLAKHRLEKVREKRLSTLKVCITDISKNLMQISKARKKLRKAHHLQIQETRIEITY